MTGRQFKINGSYPVLLYGSARDPLPGLNDQQLFLKRKKTHLNKKADLNQRKPEGNDNDTQNVVP